MGNSPSRILIVEDESMIAFMLEDIVQGLGCTAVGPAPDISTALQLIADNDVDAALLDINVNGERSFELAEILSELGKPWIFVTGYRSEDIQNRYGNIPVVAKPFLVKDVKAAIHRMLQGDALPPTPGPTARSRSPNCGM